MADRRSNYSYGGDRGTGGVGARGRGRGRYHPGGNRQDDYVSEGDRARGYRNWGTEFATRGHGTGGYGRDRSREGRGSEYYQSGSRGRGHYGYNEQRPFQGNHGGGDRNRTVPPLQQYPLTGEVEPAGRGAWTRVPGGYDGFRISCTINVNFVLQFIICIIVMKLRVAV